MNKPTAIDLFAGGGLASLGLKQGGFNVVAAVEFNPKIAGIHHLNHPRTELFVKSIDDFIQDDLMRFRRGRGPSHLHASPPCQSFSGAATEEAKAKRRSNDEHLLVFSALEAIAIIRPRSLSIENVPGFRQISKTGKPKTVYERTIERLQEMGYVISSDVYNAADFGVPQTRKRLFILGIRRDCIRDFHPSALFPFLRSPPTEWQGWYDAIVDLIPTLPEVELADWQIKRLPDKVRSSLLVSGGNGTLPRNANCHSRMVCARSNGMRAVLVDPMRSGEKTATVRAATSPAFTVRACAMRDRTNTPYLIPRDGARMSATDLSIKLSVTAGDRPAPTVRSLGSESGYHSRQFDLLENAKAWRITTRCLARFQGAPDSFQLPGVQSLAGQVIGNGVPPRMMRSLVEVFAS